MKSVFKILILSLLLIGCHQKIKPTDIAKLNGYWEIEKVVFDKGENKNYTINENYDFFRLNIDNKGIRKKVMPQLDGTFLTNNIHEKIKIRYKDNTFFIDYSTSYTKWSEELITLTDTQLVLLNAQNKEYHYKKVTPIKSMHHGKKNK